MGVLLTIRIPLSVVSLKPSPLNSKGRNCISWNPLQHMVPGWYLPMKETHVWFERWKPRGRHYYLQAGTAICAARQVKWSEVAQSGLTLCDPMDYSLQGSSVHGISQARVLEWVAISFSMGSSRPRMEPGSPSLQADALPSEPPGKPLRQQKRWLIVHMLHSATAEKRTRLENHVGSGQRTKRGTALITSKMGLSELVEVIRMAVDPRRQVWDGRHAAQQFVPASLASGLACFSFCGLCGGPVSLDLCLVFLLLFSLRILFFLHFTLLARRFPKRWPWGQEKRVFFYVWFEQVVSGS